MASPINVQDVAYQYQVGAALNAALTRAQTEIPFDLATARYIIFSDHHKGGRNNADDFVRAERAYNAALAYYYAQGYTLVVLGDVEELWEESPASVVRAYPHTLNLEARFQRQGRYWRVWGNHDLDWQSPTAVRRWLAPIYGEGVRVQESLTLRVMDGQQALGKIFLTHGHQGDTTSDRNAALARWLVRYFWRPVQLLTGYSANTPATSWALRERHNIALYRWAEQQSKLVLVAGHTHRPVFRSQSRAAQLQTLLNELEVKVRAAPDDARLRQVFSETSAELEWVRAQNFQNPGEEGAPVAMNKPCYFNTGCCAFVDGDITGLELAEGDLRLVRWPNAQGEPRAKILARAAVREVLAAC